MPVHKTRGQPAPNERAPESFSVWTDGGRPLACRLSSMTTSLARLVTEGAKVHDLPMPPIVFGVIALALFGLALAVLWSFRGTVQKVRVGTHPGPSERHDHH